MRWGSFVVPFLICLKIPAFYLHAKGAEKMKRMSQLVLTAVALMVLLVLSASAQTVNCTGVTAWAPNIQVTAGELVTFNGQEFKTIQSHTTLAGWEPPNVPALFSLVGTCGGTSTPSPTPTKPPATATPTATVT